MQLVLVENDIADQWQINEKKKKKNVALLVALMSAILCVILDVGGVPTVQEATSCPSPNRGSLPVLVGQAQGIWLSRCRYCHCARGVCVAKCDCPHTQLNTAWQKGRTEAMSTYDIPKLCSGQHRESSLVRVWTRWGNGLWRRHRERLGETEAGGCLAAVLEKERWHLLGEK